MIIRKLIFGIFLGISMLLTAFGLPEKIKKKVKKEVEKVFVIHDFELIEIQVSDSIKKELPSKITNQNFFRISEENKIIGYAFVDQAPSKTAKFDYLILFDNELKIKHAKVLIYREEYGGEIGSKRWLKQFLGKTGKDRVEFESNIDGIVGATISVRSMTKAIDNVLQTINILQSKGML